jgi:hypothetical protein
MRQDAEGITVIERLAAKGRAVFAIALAGVTLVTLPVSVLNSLFYHPNHKLGINDLLLPLLLGGLWVVEVVLIVVVVNNTWRKTILRVGPDGIVLSFASPFGTRKHDWLPSQIADVRAAPMPGGSPGYALAELQIYPGADLTVHLFTDHEERQLTWLAGAISKILGRDASGEKAEDRG